MNKPTGESSSSLIHRNVLYDPNNPITYRELVARILPATTIKSAEKFGGTQQCILGDENWFNKTLRWTMIMYFSVKTDLKGGKCTWPYCRSWFLALLVAQVGLLLALALFWHILTPFPHTPSLICKPPKERKGKPQC